MRSLLIATAAILAVSTGAFAQSANNGGGSAGPGVSQTVTSGSRTGAAARARRVTARPNRYNGTISSNGTPTTSTGGIDRGVGTTLSTSGGGGDLGNGAGGAGQTAK